MSGSGTRFSGEVKPSAICFRPTRGLSEAWDEAVSATAATGTSTQADQATFLGLNETELSPNVRAALMALLDEVGRLRQELELTRKRISHLERMADEDSMLPIANRRAFVRELGWGRLFGLWLVYPPVRAGYADGWQGRGRKLTGQFRAVYRDGEAEGGHGEERAPDAQGGEADEQGDAGPDHPLRRDGDAPPHR